MNKLELRVGKKVIAETIDLDKMVSLVKTFSEIRNDDSMWEITEDNDTLPCFDAFEKALTESGIATTKIFDVFDRCSVWNTLPNGDSVKVKSVWSKGF